MSDDLDIGSLDDCPCMHDGAGAKPRAAAAPMKYMRRRPPRMKRPRSKGKGSFCVLSHKGTVVHCYESEATANRVADAFTRRGRAGTKFEVKKR